MLCVVLIVLGCGLRLWRLDCWSLWYDEAGTIDVARSSNLLESLSLDRHPPLSFLAFRTWFGLVGTSDAAMRLLPALLSCGSLLLFALLARRWLGRARALWAVALYACSPLLVWIAQEVRMYAFVEFEALSLLLAVDQFLNGKRARVAAWLLCGIATAALVGTHYLGALACASVGAIGWIGWRLGRSTAQRLAALCAAMFVGALGWTPWLVRMMPRQLSASWGFQARITARDLVELPVRLVIVDASVLRGSLQIIGYALGIVIGLALILHCLEIARHRRPGDMLALASFVAPVGCALSLALISVPNFLPKYLTSAVPGAIMSIGCGLASIRMAALRVTLGTLAVGSCLAIAGLQKIENRREDYRSACQEVVEHWQPGDRVVAVTGTLERFSQAPLRHYLCNRPEITTSIADFSAYEQANASEWPHGTRLHVVHRDAGYSREPLIMLKRTHHLLFEGERRFGVQYLLFEVP